MRFTQPWFKKIFLLASFTLAASAITVEQLRNQDPLTPEKFAANFKRFKFTFLTEVQQPEQFLARRVGDCDDYAILAADILREKGYTPRLVAVRMNRLVHVVCYINETESYLDYNLRKGPVRTVPSGKSIREIAGHVARSFRLPWTSASEFHFENRQKILVRTVLDDPARLPASRPQLPHQEIARVESRR